MSTKPSLYVVERKEVVVLVILFVLVTVLAFTMGVKYGESLGRKAFLQDQTAQVKIQEELAGKGGSGTLGEGAAGASGAEKAAHSEAPAESTAVHAPNPNASPEELAGAHGDAHKAVEPPKAELAGGKTEAKQDEKLVESKGLHEHPKEPVDTNSDQHLLEALKDAGIQSPKAGAVKLEKNLKQSTKLPDEVKSLKVPRSGSFTVQVGSYPTRGDAEQQLKRLKENRLDAMMLAPVSERDGNWFRVTVGSFSTKAEAERSGKQWQSKGQIKNFFVRKMN